MDSELYSKIGASKYFRPGEMESSFAKFKSMHGKTSYEEMLVNLSFAPGTRVLELPSGSAPIARLLLRRFGSKIFLEAVDFNPKEIQAISDDRILKKCESAQNLSANNNSFDFVLCHLGIMLFNPLEPALSEIFRVLVPGGKFVANVITLNESRTRRIFSSTSNRYLDFVEGFPGWGDPRGKYRLALQALFRKIGFSNTVDNLTYCVAFRASPIDVIDTARVFFQVNFLLDDETRTKYFAELEKNLEPVRSCDGTIELEICFERLILEKPFPWRTNIGTPSCNGYV